MGEKLSDDVVMEEALVGEKVVKLGNNPIKQLCRFYGEKEGLSALQFYKFILQDSLGLHSSHQVVSVLNDRNASRFYGSSKQEPRYLSIKNHGSLVRLSRLVRREIVILQVFPGKDKIDPLKVFDSRGPRFSSQNLEGGSEAGSATRKLDLFYIMYRPNDEHTLYWIRKPEKHYPQGLDCMEENFVYTADNNVDEPCYLKRLAKLLKVESREVDEQHKPWSLFDLCIRSTDACRLLGGKTVVLCYHLGTLPVKGGKWSLRERLSTKRQSFRVLGVVRDSDLGSIPWAGALVVSFASEGRIYEVVKSQADAIIHERSKLARCTARDGNSALPNDLLQAQRRKADSDDDEGEDEGDNLGPGRKRKKKRKKAKAKWQRKGDKVGSLSPCKCPSCIEAEKYRYHMGPLGSQHLYRIPFDICQYLKIFDLDTQENREAVRTCLRLSMMSMDVESVTVNAAEVMSIDRGLGRRPGEACRETDQDDSSEEEEEDLAQDSDDEDGGIDPGRRKNIRRPPELCSSSSEEDEPNSIDESGVVEAAPMESDGLESSNREGDLGGSSPRAPDSEPGSEMNENEEGNAEDHVIGAHRAGTPTIPFEHLSSVPRADPSGEEVVALQRPIVIGHLDNLNEPQEPSFFEVKGGIEGVQVVVDSYINHLLERRCVAQGMKENLLSPLLDFCKRYKEAHVEFFDQQQIDDRTTRRVWDRTLIGLFEKELYTLINHVYIFTFNGAGENCIF